MDFYRSYFGRKFAAALEAKGVTKVAIAEELGVDPSAVTNWAKGKAFPDDDRMPDICNALGVDISHFDPDGLSPDFRSAADFLSTFASRPIPYQKVILALLYKDPSRVRGLSEKISKPVQALISIL